MSIARFLARHGIGLGDAGLLPKAEDELQLQQGGPVQIEIDDDTIIDDPDVIKATSGAGAVGQTKSFFSGVPFAAVAVDLTGSGGPETEPTGITSDPRDVRVPTQQEHEVQLQQGVPIKIDDDEDATIDEADTVSATSDTGAIQQEHELQLQQWGLIQIENDKGAIIDSADVVNATNDTGAVGQVGRHSSGLPAAAVAVDLAASGGADADAQVELAVALRTVKASTAEVSPVATAVPPMQSKFLGIAKPFIPNGAVAIGTPELRVAFDTESDGLAATATKLHCLAIVHLGTGRILDYGPDRIAEGLEYLSRATFICGHNLLGHDLPLLERLHGWRPTPGCTVEDTLVLSRMLLPNILELDNQAVAMGDPAMGRHHGKHSIAAWGLRLRKCKQHEDITDWSTWTPEMQERCIVDAQITTQVWQFLHSDAYSREARELEHRIAPLCARIQEDGVPINATMGRKLRDELTTRKAALGAQLTQQFGSWLVPINPAAQDDRAGAPLTRCKRVAFNPSSRQHIAKALQDRGWEPNERTPTGRPKIDDQVIAGIVSKFPEFAGLADYLVAERRLGQLATGDEAWLKHVRSDGRIHGAMNPMGTPHSRASHFNPNLAAVPKVTSPWGKECRELFEAPEGWFMVGGDQAGLQARAFAHYLAEIDGGAYGKALLEDDTHWNTVLALGLQPEGTARDKQSDLHTILREEGAKPFYYAFLFGGRSRTIGSIIHDALQAAVQKDAAYEVLYHRFFKSKRPDTVALRRVGEKALSEFESRTPGLRQLQHALQEQAGRNGWLLGLDGRRVPVRSMHSVLNFLVTSAEAVICKRWLADTYDELRATFRYGWDGDVVVVLWIHDEIVCCCRAEIADQVGEILVRNAKQAGAPYQFRMPLECAYKAGRSWAEIH
jgi:DNA polymerase I-like protein with 3'-5' exonuclease and polymerase domains